MCAGAVRGQTTDADMQTVLPTLKQVLESNGMPITYYDITLVPGGDYGDHSAYMADVIKSFTWWRPISIAVENTRTTFADSTGVFIVG